MNYPMYGNNQFYLQDLQNLRDKVDKQMQQIQMQQQQQPMPMQQPTNLTQNFQLAPNMNNNTDLESRYATTIDDVKNTLVVKTGIFVTKDFSTIWIKDVTGKIRTFNTIEVIEMDDKDREIYALKKQIEEMKGMIKNEPANTDINEPIESKKSTRISNNKQSNAK